MSRRRQPPTTAHPPTAPHRHNARRPKPAHPYPAYRPPRTVLPRVRIDQTASTTQPASARSCRAPGKPSNNRKLTLTLQNAIDAPVKVAITPHTAYTNVNGTAEYGKTAETPDSTLVHSLDKLIEAPEPIELAGKETKTVSLWAKPARRNLEGFLAGGRGFQKSKEETEEDTSDEEGLAIKNEFAYVIGVVVSNSRASVRPDLDLIDVFPDQLNYRNVVSATLQKWYADVYQSTGSRGECAPKRGRRRLV